MQNFEARCEIFATQRRSDRTNMNMLIQFRKFIMFVLDDLQCTPEDIAGNFYLY